MERPWEAGHLEGRQGNPRRTEAEEREQGGTGGKVMATTTGTCGMCGGHRHGGSAQDVQSKHSSNQAHMSGGRGDMASHRGRSAAPGEPLRGGLVTGQRGNGGGGGSQEGNLIARQQGRGRRGSRR